MKTSRYLLPALCLMLAAALPAAGQDTTRPNVPDRGVKPIGAYSVSDVENISLTNGNVNLSIPLASLPPIAGGKLSWPLRAEYNSKLWDFDALNQLPDQIHSSPYVINLIQQSITGGWRVGSKYSIREDRLTFHFSGAIPPCVVSDCRDATYIYKMFLTTPDGTEHELRTTDFQSFPTGQLPAVPFRQGYYKDTPATTQTRARYYSTDGSYLFATIEPYPADSFLATPQNWTVYMPDGTTVQQLNGVQTITDNDGNNITITSTTDANGVITTTFVGAGATQRQIQYVFDPNGGGGAGHGQVMYFGVTGVQEIIDINFATISLNGLVYNLDDQSCQDMSTPMGFQSINVVRSIQYPTSEPGVRLQYAFNYNSESTGPDFDYHRQCTNDLTHVVGPSKGWGSVSHMSTPSGATVDYTYNLDNNGALVCCDPSKRPPVETITKKVLNHDGTSDTWNYNINYTTPETPGNELTRVCSVTGPDGSNTQQSFYTAGSSTNGGLQNLVFKTVQSSSSTQTITERVWGLNARFTGADTGSNLLDPSGTIAFNPVVLTEFVTVTGSTSKMSGKTFQYDINGNRVQETDYDWVTLDPNLPRDSHGVPTGPPTGTVLRQISDTYHNSATAYALRSTSGQPRIIDALEENSVTLGSTQLSDTQLSYDNQNFGRPPTLGHVTSQANKIDSTHTATTQHAYDSLGNLQSTTDPDSNITTYVYGDPSLGLPTSIIVDPKNGTSQQTTQIAYDPFTGKVTSTTDPNGNPTTTDYVNVVLAAIDPFGRPGTVTSPKVTSVVGTQIFTAQQRKTVTSYFDAELRIAVASDMNQSGDGILKTQTTVDMLHRPIKAERSEDGSTNYAISAQTVYQQMGRITFTSNPARTGGATTDGWTRTTKDEMGRIVEVATFDGATQPPVSGTNSSWTGSVITSFTSNQVTVTDQAGNSRSSLVDSLGRLVQVNEDPGGLNFQTTYGYDPLGNLTNVNQGNTQGMQTRTYIYDGLSRLTQAKNPEQVDPRGTQVATIYSYDLASNLLSKANPNGTSVSFTYDGLNRVHTKALTNGPTNINYTYTYDTAPGGVGKLKSVLLQAAVGAQMQNDGYSYSGYDALGRPTGGQQITMGMTYGLSYGYDLAGHVTSETYPSSKVVLTGYDNAGRVSGVMAQVGSQTNTYASAMSYTAPGPLAAMTLGNNLVEHTSYNGRVQPTVIGLGTSATDSSKLELDYTYGVLKSDGMTVDLTKNNGNPQSQTITAAGTVVGIQSYTYDTLNRLGSVAEALTAGGAPLWSQTYQCDRFGNMAVTASPHMPVVPQTPQALSAFNPSTNQIQTPNTTYDASGNLTNDGHGGSYVYDPENHMTSCTVNGVSSAYAYDAEEHRVLKAVGSASPTTLVYDIAGKLVAEYGGPTSSSNAGTSYLTTDHLGSTRVVTSSTGGVIARHDYLPFGTEIQAQFGGRTLGQGYNNTTDDTRQKFTSKERDNESGLDYFEARYYSSAQGRFTSPDEFKGGPTDLFLLYPGEPEHQPLPYADVRNPQSLNKYQYGYDSPLRYVDPDGHQTKDQPKSVWDAFLDFLGLYTPTVTPDPRRQAVLDQRIPGMDGMTVGEANQAQLQGVKQAGEAIDTVLSFLDPTGAHDVLMGSMTRDPSRMVIGLAGMVLGGGKSELTLGEAKNLVGGWSKATFLTIADSLRYHFEKHGAEVGAKDIWQFLRKAAAFNTKGAIRRSVEGGVKYIRKDGTYIIKDLAGKIITYGRE